MEVSYERDDHGLTTITAQVPAEQVDELYQKAVKQLRKHVTLPGFRPGRVPPKMVESVLGSDRILEYVQEMVQEQAAPEAVAAVPELVLLDEVDVNVGDVKRGEATELTIKAQTAVVDLGEYRGLPVDMPVRQITDADVEEELFQYRRRQGQFELADHNDLRDGDVARLALAVLHNGRLADSYDEEDNLRLVMGRGEGNPPLDEHLLGMTVGEERTFTVHLPSASVDDDEAATDATEPYEYTVELLAIETLEPLDSFLAREAPDQTADDVRQALRQQLQQRAEAMARQQARDALVRQAVEQASIDLPRAMIEAEVMEEIEEYEDSLEEAGTDLDELDDAELEQAYADIRERVQYSRQSRAFLDALARAEALTVERDDLAYELTMIGLMNNVEPDLIMRRLDEQDQLGVVIDAARRRKASNRLLELATVRTVMVDEAGQTSPAPEAVPAPVSAAGELAEVPAAEDIVDELDEDVTAEPEDEPCP